jgi:hypothetical protein
VWQLEQARFTRNTFHTLLFIELLRERSAMELPYLAFIQYKTIFLFSQQALNAEECFVIE